MTADRGAADRVIKGVFFDLYGTLLLYGDMQAAWRDWLETFHAGLTDAGIEVDRDVLAAGLHGFVDRPEPPADARGRTLFERRVTTSCAELGLHPPDDVVSRLSTACIAAWQRHVTVDPLAHEVLTQLGAAHTLALVTNFDHEPHVHALLDETGLRPHFASVVVSAEIGVKKPDPRIFDGVLRTTGLRPDEVVYVGDADVDVEASCAAGIHPIRILRREGIDDLPHDFYRDDAVRPPATTTDASGVAQIACLTELAQLLD